MVIDRLINLSCMNPRRSHVVVRACSAMLPVSCVLEHGGLSARLIFRVDAPIFNSGLEAHVRDGWRLRARHNDGIGNDGEH